MLGQDLIRRRCGRAATRSLRSRAASSTSPTPSRPAARCESAPRPTSSINCAAWTDVDGAEDAAGRGAGRQRRRRGQRCRRGGRRRCVDDPRLDRLRVRRAPSASRTSSPTRSARCRQYGSSKLAGERAVAELAPDSHTIVRTSWLFGVGGRCFPATIMRLAGERDELTVVDDQSGCPTFTGHLANGLLALADRRLPGIVHVAGGGQCSWYEFATEIVESAELECEVLPGTSEDLTTRPTPGVQRAGHRSRGRRAAAAGVAGWAGGVHHGEGERGMRLLVCGGAGFIGSTFVRLRVQRARRRRDGARQADLRGPAGEPERRDRRHPVRPRRDRGPGCGRRRGLGLRRDRQLRRRDARRSLDLRPGGVHRHQHAGHPRAARGRARARSALRPGVDRRGLRLDRGGVVHRVLAAGAVEPVQRHQDRRRPARVELLPHLWAGDA